MQPRAAQAQTEYLLLLFVSVGLLVGVTRYSGQVSEAYGGGAAALSEAGGEEAGQPPELVFRVPGPLRISTGVGPGTMTFLRRTPEGWAPLSIGDVITTDMEFAVEVTFEDDPQVSSTAAFIKWGGKEPPPGDLSAVVLVEAEPSANGAGTGGAAGAEGLAANVPVERMSDGRYRSGPLRLSEVLASFR
jgi:hypothetical protein